ncbi:MAG: right-handed parallel beta-helix repeat-containing protein [Anaerolineae bacterium]|jgi:predicted outer membrane repeat protein|nr:right-handed parallel beta-helix repeat-containing protein [Anaerolineae bacterium]
MINIQKMAVWGILLLMLSVAIVTPARADSLVSECTERALQIALEAGGDVQLKFDEDCVIVFSVTAQLYADVAVTNIGDTSVVFDGDARGRLFEVNFVDATFTNITFRNTDSTTITTGAGDFGGAFSNYGNLTLIGCVFENNKAGQGGAIFSTGGIVTIEDSLFINNSAVFGGAIGAVDDTISITNSRFVQNNADVFGSVLIAATSTMTITNSQIVDNTALSSATIFNDRSQLTIDGVLFANNISEDTTEDPLNDVDADDTIAGAIFNYLGEMTITNSTFTGNSADYGGAIANAGGNATLTHNTFVGNVAVESGDTLQTSDKLFGQAVPVGEMILAGNIFMDGACVGDGEATFTDGGNNIQFNAPDCFGDKFDPEVKLLDDLYFLAQNPAEYDAPCLLETDQLGQARPLGASCTIGAIELDDDGALALPEATPAP